MAGALQLSEAATEVPYPDAVAAEMAIERASSGDASARSSPHSALLGSRR